MSDIFESSKLSSPHVLRDHAGLICQECTEIQIGNPGCKPGNRVCLNGCIQQQAAAADHKDRERVQKQSEANWERAYYQVNFGATMCFSCTLTSEEGQPSGVLSEY